MPVIQFGEQFRALGPGVLTIGSAPEAGWRIHEHDLEPLHLVLVPERGGRTLLSAGSERARVLVNGAPLESGSRDLAIGDVIEAGSASLTFRHHPGAADLTAPAFLRDMRHGRLYKLTATTAIGRDPSCAVLLREPEVSRAHAEVRAAGESGYQLVPTGGVTLLNGERLTATAMLTEGDEVTIGRTQLRFSRQVPQHVHMDAGNRSASDLKGARSQTMFIGAMESRDFESRRSRRKLGRIALICGAIVVLAVLLVTRFTGPGTANGAPPAAVTTPSR